MEVKSQGYARAMRFEIEKAGFMTFLICLCSLPVTVKSP